MRQKHEDEVDAYIFNTYKLHEDHVDDTNKLIT